ncbi:MAG: ImmA/IrrE family metallo-endopeptidase [Candidatus Bipolaricaulota bacterium]
MTLDDLAQKVGTKRNPAPIREWEGAQKPVDIPVRLVEKLAKATRAPFGVLFLDKPPADELPLRDFRRPGGTEPRGVSLNLIETVLETQLRQAWLSEQLEQEGEAPLDFIGSAKTSDDPTRLAAKIRDRLRIGTAERRAARRTADAPLWLIGRLDESGITVTRKGFAGRATKRTLDRDEFKGFALADRFAPFIFVNGKDWPASQVFTIAHECVHLWLGESALPDGDWFGTPSHPTERFCNQVAAEVLLPAEEVRDAWRASESLKENVIRIGQGFRVSSLAVLFRARSTNLIGQMELDSALTEFRAEFEAREEPASGGGGGDHYNNVSIYFGKRFVREVLLSVMTGKTLYSEAFDLLGTRKTRVVQEMAARFL